jgi:hypothetical protein
VRIDQLRKPLLFIDSKSCCVQFTQVCCIWGFDGGYNEEQGHLGYNGAQLEGSQAVRENISAPCSGSMCNPSKKQQKLATVFLPEFWGRHFTLLLSSFCRWGVNSVSLYFHAPASFPGATTGHTDTRTLHLSRRRFYGMKATEPLTSYEYLKVIIVLISEFSVPDTPFNLQRAIWFCLLHSNQRLGAENPVLMFSSSNLILTSTSGSSYVSRLFSNCISSLRFFILCTRCCIFS